MQSLVETDPAWCNQSDLSSQALCCGKETKISEGEEQLRVTLSLKRDSVETQTAGPAERHTSVEFAYDEL